MLALIDLALAYASLGRRQGFLVPPCIALALTTARRLNNTLVAWTDLLDLTPCTWLAG